MKRRFLSSVLALAMIVSLNAVQVNEASFRETNAIDTELHGNIYEYEKLVTNYGWPWTAITKTITKNYNTADVPVSVYYTEYIDGKWYGGTLERTGNVLKVSSNIWQATYTGKINY